MTGQWSRDSSTPPFIDLVPIEGATGARKELYDEMERVRGPGRVSNLFKAYAAFPALAKANFQRLMVLLSQGNLSVKFKEAVMTALAEAGYLVHAVDLPGYGYASGPRKESQAWRARLDDYVRQMSERGIVDRYEARARNVADLDTRGALRGRHAAARLLRQHQDDAGAVQGRSWQHPHAVRLDPARYDGPLGNHDARFETRLAQVAPVATTR